MISFFNDGLESDIGWAVDAQHARLAEPFEYEAKPAAYYADDTPQVYLTRPGEQLPFAVITGSRLAVHSPGDLVDALRAYEDLTGLDAPLPDAEAAIWQKHKAQNESAQHAPLPNRMGM